MTWTTPKTDWKASDGIANTDLNRIEENSSELRQVGEALGFKQGFEIFCNNAEALSPTLGDSSYNIKVRGGACFSQSARKGMIFGDFSIRKILSSSSWTSGNSNTSPCKAPGATLGSNQWWYIFILQNPTTGAFDIAMDTSVSGANIAGSTIESAGYTMWKRIGSVLENNDNSELQNTFGSSNRFHMSYSGITGNDYSESTNINLGATITLNHEQLTGTPTLIPPNFNMPVLINIVGGDVHAGATPPRSITIGSAAHGTSFPDTRVLLDSDTSEKFVWVTPYNNQIYISSVYFDTIFYRVIAYDDNYVGYSDYSVSSDSGPGISPPFKTELFSGSGQHWAKIATVTFSEDEGYIKVPITITGGISEVDVTNSNLYAIRNGTSQYYWIRDIEGSTYKDVATGDYYFQLLKTSDSTFDIYFTCNTGDLIGIEYGYIEQPIGSVNSNILYYNNAEWTTTDPNPTNPTE